MYVYSELTHLVLWRECTCFVCVLHWFNKLEADMTGIYRISYVKEDGMVGSDAIPTRERADLLFHLSCNDPAVEYAILLYAGDQDLWRDPKAIVKWYKLNDYRKMSGVE